MNTVCSNRQTLALLSLVVVAISTLSTFSVSAFQASSLPPISPYATSTARLSTSLSAAAKRPLSSWKAPFGASSRQSATAASSPSLTPLQQSSLTSGEVAGHGGSNPAGTSSRRSRLVRGPINRLVQLKEHLTSKTISDKVPSYGKLLKFCATTVLIWLSEPLLSLVDTTVVGWTQGSASVVQLASLGPATTLMDTLLYMTYFLALSTTNLLTQGLAQKDWRGLQRWTSYLLTVAVLVGGGVTALIMSPAGPALLNALAGSAATPELLTYATQYTRIRAAVAPFSVLGMVAQSFCLANLRSRAPLLAVGAASLVNIVGDLALSKHGVVGAAIATAIASMSSTAILMNAVRHQFKQWRKQEEDEWKEAKAAYDIRQELYAETDLEVSPLSMIIGPSNGTEPLFVDEGNLDTTMTVAEVATRARVEASKAPELIESTSFSSESSTATDNEETTTLAAATTDSPPKAIPFFSIPDRKSLFKLATISGPLCINMWAKMASYAALTVKTTSFGVVPLAAHNVLMRLFFFLGCFADAMGLSAQAFLPPNLYPFDKKSYHATLDRLRGVTAVVALVLGRAALGLVQTAGPYLARDGAMRAAMQSQASMLGWALFLHPLVVMMEGTVIATRDFGNLMVSYAGALAVHCFTVSTATSFGGVWQALVTFQALRFLNLNIFRRKDPLKNNYRVQTAAEASA